jgi:hypothetical protein
MEIAHLLSGYTLGAADFCAGLWARRSLKRWIGSGVGSLTGL